MTSRRWAYLVALLMVSVGSATFGCALSHDWAAYPAIVGALFGAIGLGTLLGLLISDR